MGDNMFVVPTTTREGWLCKVFSVALEVFQLGALCPAAIFTHGDCLQYTNPFGVSLHMVSHIVVTFGYGCWGFLLISMPLALCSLAMVGVMWVSYQVIRFASFALLRCCGGRGCAQRIAVCLESADSAFQTKLRLLIGMLLVGGHSLFSGVMLLAFWPLLLGGMLL